MPSDNIHLYFAYGMNMDEARMHGRCPGATLIGPAVLPHHRFIINLRGVATVVPEVGASVYGLLWRLTANDIAELDRFEGVASGYYRRAVKDVTTSDHSCVHVDIYVADDATPGEPRAGYLERILAAADRWQFPAVYMEVLSKCRVTDGQVT